MGGEYLKHSQKAMSRRYLPSTSYPGDPRAPLYKMVGWRHGRKSFRLMVDQSNG